MSKKRKSELLCAKLILAHELLWSPQAEASELPRFTLYYSPRKHFSKNELC